MPMAACGFPRPADVVGDDAAVDASVDGAGVDATPGGPPPSCVDLPATCGPRGNDSCCTSLDVPGGTYHRSYDKAGDGNLGDLNAPATISGFRLDKYEVNVGRFRAFVAAGMGSQISPPKEGAGVHPDIPGSGWQSSWNANLPANAAVLVAGLCSADSGPWTNTPGPNENRPMNCLS